MKVSSLLVLGVVILVFLATPLVSLARGTGSISQRNGNNGNGNNGNGNKLQNLLSNLPDLPNLPDLGKLQKLLGGNNGNNGNDNNGNGNNGLCGIDLSNINLQDLLDQISQLLGNGGNGGGNNIQARSRASSKQSSSVPSAKLNGIVQFSTIQATKTQATRQTAAAKQDGGLTLTFKIVPKKVVSLNKGDFIQASFDGKVESGLSLGGGKADLFDPVTGLPTTVQLS